MSELAKYLSHPFVQASGWNYTEALVMVNSCCLYPL